jgi:hypothetical protein
LAQHAGKRIFLRLQDAYTLASVCPLHTQPNHNHCCVWPRCLAAVPHRYEQQKEVRRRRQQQEREERLARKAAAAAEGKVCVARLAPSCSCPYEATT